LAVINGIFVTVNEQKKVNSKIYSQVKVTAKTCKLQILKASFNGLVFHEWKHLNCKNFDWIFSTT